jgi:hypothetical protein
MIQSASDAGNADALVFFLFDLLYLDDDAISTAPLRERKERLRAASVGHRLRCTSAITGLGGLDPFRSATAATMLPDRPWANPGICPALLILAPWWARFRRGGAAARGMVAGLICLLLAHIRAFLGLAVISVTTHVVGL